MFWPVVALVAGLATAAPAQESAPACEGTTPAEWIGGPGADVSSATAPLSGEFTMAADAASYAAFRVSAPSQSVRIEVTGDGDPAVTLSTADGEEIDSADDTGWSLDSLLETTLGPGTYCLTVTEVDSEPMSATVQVSRPDQTPLLEPGPGDAEGEFADCGPDTEAQPLVGQTAPARLDSAMLRAGIRRDVTGEEISYLRFSLAEPTPMKLGAASDDLDPEIRLFDDTGTLVAENDDANGTDAGLDFPAGLPAGEYCLGVAALSPDAGTIRVTADWLDREAYLRAAYRRGEIAPPADAAYPMETIGATGQQQVTVLHDGSAKWFSIEVPSESVLMVDGVALMGGGDPKLTLFDAGGTIVSDSDDVDASLSARVGPVLLTPGSYRLALVDVDRNGTETGTVRPMILNFRRFVPAK